jgi:Uma2 family endonuclease
MVAGHKQAYTLDDLRVIEALPENIDKRFELIDGSIELVNPPKPKHAYTADRFYVALDHYGQETQSGIAFSDSVGYDLPNGDSLIPDASFVSREQIWFPLPDDNFTFAPLVAVEVASPSNSSRDLYDKAESFLECGTKVVWIAYLGKQIVDVCHRNPDGKLVVEKLGLNATISGEDILPGFTLPVKDIFPPQE